MPHMPHHRFDWLRVATSAQLPVNAVFAFTPEKTRGVSAVHYWPPKRGVEHAPEHVSVFFPGNPGCLDYYTNFCEQLYEQLPESHAIIAFSNIGGDPRFPPPEAGPLDMSAHLETKIEFVQGLKSSLGAWAQHSGDATPTVSLIGHSVGAFLAAETMKHVDVQAGYLLFPTLGWIADSPNGWKMWPIFKTPVRQSLPLLAYAINPIAGWLTKTIGFDDTTASLISTPASVKAVLEMAASEMATITAPDFDWYKKQADKRLGSGVHGVWSDGSRDGWVGKDGPMIREVLGEERCRVLDGVPHAFCLKPAHNKRVSEAVAGWMNGATTAKANGAAH